MIGFFVAPASARADDDDPLPPPPTPRPAAPREAPPPADPPLDRLMGNVGIGTTILLKTEEYAFFSGNVGITKWWRNVGLGASFGWGLNSGSTILNGDIGFRLLGSSGQSGPFVGGGFGFRRYDLDDRKVGGFRGMEIGAGAHVEVGVIVRGIFSGGVRGDLPFFGVTGAGGQLSPAARLVPIALTAQLGFMF